MCIRCDSEFRVGIYRTVFIDSYPVRGHIKIVTAAAFIKNIGKYVRYGFVYVNLRDACVQFRHKINRNIEIGAKPYNRFLCIHIVKLICFLAFIEIPTEIRYGIFIFELISVIDSNYNTAEYLNVGAEVYDVAKLRNIGVRFVKLNES